MARKTTVEKLTSKKCKHCSNGFQGRPNKQYCSDKCATAARVNRHREKKTDSKVRKYIKKADKFAQTSFGRCLYKELKRAGTVQVLEGHNAESLHELHRLKRECTKFSGYDNGKPTGSYHQSHIWPVKADNGKIGMLHPENLVIAPRPFNLAHGTKQPTRQGVGRFIPTTALLEAHKLREHDTAAEVFKKVRQLLGQEWTTFIATLTIQQTQKQQLRAKLKKLDIQAPAHMSLDELRRLAVNHEVSYFTANFTASESLTVALSELSRFGHEEGEFSFYHRSLDRLWGAVWSLDADSLSDGELVVASCLLNETWAILHGVDLPKRSKREQEELNLFAVPKTCHEEPETIHGLTEYEAEEEWIL